MGLVTYLVVLAVSGLIVGALARLALPGKDPLTLFQTMLVGWVGSFGAGLLGSIAFGYDYAGITLSILGATVVVYFVRRRRGGGVLDPGTPPDRG